MGRRVSLALPHPLLNSGHRQVVMAGDGAGRFLLAWQDDSNGTWDVYASLFQPLLADFSSAPQVGWPPFQAVFTDTSTPAGEANSWLWDFGNDITSTLQHPVYTYNTAGYYTVTQFVTDTTTGEWDTLV
ncbi:MAG: PKD domain-containing protein, partial [Candidatus Altiarchaeales archaeon]|nr:PKD domain-containing protein [Candidatus Altiarchaeales archaeon]